MVDGEAPRIVRKGHYSCDFCRSRKLRCDRPMPCTNCIARDKECVFGPVLARRSRRKADSEAISRVSDQPSTSATPRPPPVLQQDLLAEIQALKRLAHDLETRVNASTGNDPCNGIVVTLTPSGSEPSPSWGGLGTGIGTPSHGQVIDVVAHLQRVSRSEGSQTHIEPKDILFKIDNILTIPDRSRYTAHHGRQARCIHIPRHDEAKVLVDFFLTNLNYIYHVVHPQSLSSMVDALYAQIDKQEPVTPGRMVLLLAVFASSTHAWTTVGAAGLFPSPGDAHTQAHLWIKATHDVLHAEQGSPPFSLEAVLGTVVLSFITCNIEGVSMRYRGLISTGLVLGRELGLHRLDGEASGGFNGGVIAAEMGRRAWWYLAATDWLLAARYGGPNEGVYQVNPRHMAVNKPRNIDDADLVEGDPNVDRPLSQPTDMSYFLQRLRLAEVSRAIVDHTSMAMRTSARATHHAHVMSLDFELHQMTRDVPPFLDINNYPDTPAPEMHDMFIQAYMLNSLVQTQRCAIHLEYLISGDPAYASSRETCIGAARQILRAEQQLLRSRHPFVQTRGRLSAILHGVFMASIVLLMDACVNGGEDRNGREVAEALRIVGDAQEHSLAAQKLHEALVQVLARHREQAAAAEVAGVSRPADDVPGDQFSLETLMDAEGFQWDDLFFNIDMSFF
ncbi:hypothetical protein F5X68DRAFT_24635 [Plectosphaerella plurivora]|uniref:Zn(2)-C6 fungal-type domain-containing protein n=1 Tax=Plectosphaerella plurivora TaxID=936078 RepID=A0A9P8V8F8_9PEZI|nr:hypothetical protein F5X68DRAFT_24635 [Plectosphaerella plurivora]